MDREQQRRFQEAVERKAQESEQASRAEERGVEVKPDTPQQHDQVGPRDKSSRHGQVTADKWNQ